MKNTKYEAEHLTFWGNSVMRSSEQIYESTIQILEHLHISYGMKTVPIYRTPFLCHVRIRDDYAIFYLIKNEIIVTTTICCFTENDVALSIVDKHAEAFIKSSGFLPPHSLFFRKPSSYKWLYSFVTKNVLANKEIQPDDLRLAGEIEFYIYDAIKRGLKL